jgi:S1-C subfamily serine protease
VAAAAGVKTGDFLLAFDRLPVPDKEALATLLAAKRWGDRVTLDVRRGGQPVTLTARLRRVLPAPLATAAPLPF